MKSQHATNLPQELYQGEEQNGSCFWVRERQQRDRQRGQFSCAVSLVEMYGTIGNTVWPLTLSGGGGGTGISQRLGSSQGWVVHSLVLVFWSSQRSETGCFFLLVLLPHVFPKSSWEMGGIFISLAPFSFLPDKEKLWNQKEAVPTWAECIWEASGGCCTTILSM